MLRAGRGRYIDLESPRGYHLDYSYFMSRRAPRDPAGLPVWGRADGAPVYSPGAVAREALGSLEVYLENGAPGRKRTFEAAARWLAESAEDVPGSFSGWPEPAVPSAYESELEPGWFSGAAQAECVSVLVRAATLLKQEGALEACRRAVVAFDLPVEDGGFLREVGDGGHEGGLDSLAMVEEYPMPGRPSMTLGGHARAMWAVFDYGRATGDPSAGVLLGRLARGLEFMIDRYDVGWWSRWDLDESFRGINVADRACHAAHILQLETLHRMTAVEMFRTVSRRWEGYAAAPGVGPRVFWHRARFRLMNGVVHRSS